MMVLMMISLCPDHHSRHSPVYPSSYSSFRSSYSVAVIMPSSLSFYSSILFFLFILKNLISWAFCGFSCCSHFLLDAAFLLPSTLPNVSSLWWRRGCPSWIGLPRSPLSFSFWNFSSWRKWKRREMKILLKVSRSQGVLWCSPNISSPTFFSSSLWHHPPSTSA